MRSLDSRKNKNLPDGLWFAERPGRQYRLRHAATGLVAVKKVDGRFLRVAVGGIPPDGDFDDPERLAELAWWTSVWGGADRQVLQDAIRRARRRRS